MLLSLQKMMERVENAQSDSDTSLFLNLMYAGEMTVKTVVLCLIAGLNNSSDRHKYRQLHKIARADGLGDWLASLDDILIGPASQQLPDILKVEQKALLQKVTVGSWQFEAAAALDRCLRTMDHDREGLPFKVDGRKWFSLFVELRNRTRGHGAPLTCPHVLVQS